MAHSKDGVTWHPEIRRELLPGPSARSLGVVSFGVACVTFGAVAFLFTMMFLGATHVIATAEVWPTSVALYSFSGGALLMGRGRFSPMLWIVEKRSRKERAAGYTTMHHDALEKECPVDVVDVPSRRVIRLAGEHLVESKYAVDQVNQVRERTRQVRQAAQQERNLSLTTGPAQSQHGLVEPDA
ncbi:hypothetical protein [Xylanimonas sp. McL0601]|uniref:hypothetical protein n=1 Tax=Xylanimonas sp. McL0601 TaxID=3414739 RepID=UPI003CF1E00D